MKRGERLSPERSADRPGTARSCAEELSKMVSEFRVSDSEDAERFGFSPEIILYPEDVGQISRVMRFASRNGARIFPLGGGTGIFLGNPVRGADAVLSLSRLGRVLFHEPSDMVSTVECGAGVAEFQETVGRENQIFPVDAPRTGFGATVGGLVSSNLCGPLSTRYGTCRELILGAKAVRADGEIINVGGKVVKNVAGYDIPKLITGSLGTLCVLAEATFRLYPAQPFSATLVLGFSDHASCARAAEALLAADMVPTCFEMLDGELSSEFGAAPGAERSILLRFDSFEEAVREQARQAKDAVSGQCAAFSEMDGESSRRLWDAVGEFPASHDAGFSARLALPVTASVRALSDIGAASQLAGLSVRSLARPARGVAVVSVGGGDEEAVQAARFLENLADSLGGRIIFPGIRSGIRGKIRAWGRFGEALPLMRKIKRRLDPGDVLPGEKIFGAD